MMTIVVLVWIFYIPVVKCVALLLVEYDETDYTYELRIINLEALVLGFLFLPHTMDQLLFEWWDLEFEEEEQAVDWLLSLSGCWYLILMLLTPVWIVWTIVNYARVAYKMLARIKNARRVEQLLEQDGSQ